MKNDYLNSSIALQNWYRDLNASLGIYTLSDVELEQLNSTNSKEEVAEYISGRIFERLTMRCKEKSEENRKLFEAD